MPTAEANRRKSKRRQAAAYTDDEDDEQSVATTSEAARSTKRAKTDERSLGGASIGDVDVDVESEERKPEDGDDDAYDEDTRFLPPTAAKPKPAKARGRGQRKSIPSKKRRAVVLSDDEAEGDYREEDDPGAVDDDDFSPEPSVRRSAGAGTKTNGKASRKSSSGPIDKDIILGKDERRSIPPAVAQGAKRAHPSEDEDPIDVETVTKEPTPPPLKKRKLPTIKKNKPPVGSTTASTPSTSRPPAKPEGSVGGNGISGAKDAFALGQRKTAAGLGNADFDLRDASVYAQLFTKVCLTHRISQPR